MQRKRPKPTAHQARPAGRTVPQASGSGPMATMYNTAVAMGVTERVLRALFLIGRAENDWNTTTCNSSNHCGLFQLDSTWQAQHDYHDIAYWTRFAVNTGFYSYGGLAHIDRTHPTWSIGEMVEACQGAGPTFSQAATYYNGRLGESDADLTRTRGGAHPAPVVPVVKPRKLYFNPLEHANVTPERIDDGVDYAGTGYYVAIADCKITRVVPDHSGWENEGYVEYQIVTDGPLKDVYVYYAEGVIPSVAENEFVRGGEKICGLRVPMPFGTEIGFAAGTQELSWATKYGGGHHTHWEVGGVTNVATAAGIAFSRLIQRLGGPPGIIEGPIRGTYPPWAPGGQIPSGVTPAPTTPTGSAIAGSPTNAQQLASGYKWPNDLWSAFWELHNGMGEASHHSHAAWEHARNVKYRTTKP